MTRLSPRPSASSAASMHAMPAVAVGVAIAAGAMLAIGVALAQPGVAGADATAVPQAQSTTAAQPQSAGLAREDVAWARGALRHAARLEIVDADPTTGLITVRVRNAGGSPGSASGTRAAAGRVLLAGPGYRIAAAGPSAAASAPATADAAGGAELAGSVPLEHRNEPIVCQGARLLHIDNRNLEFAGDAVRAEQGCEVHITNSRIVAQGIGVSASAASVHIDNSSIAGGEGAISASDGAQVYARSSTFKGMIRRLGTSAFHDLGGNAGD